MKNTIMKLVLLTLTLVWASFGQDKKDTNSAKTENLGQQITRIAVREKIDPRLFYALIYAESTFKLSARSPKGAGCLTQLMPATARRFGLRVDAQVDERFSNLEKCLTAGAQYLAFQLRTFRDVRLALAGYNAGEGAVIKYGYRVPPYKETVQYVEKICAIYYGQRGHGIVLAYNQTQANGWVVELYNNWRGAQRIVQTLPTNAVVPQPSPNTPVGKTPNQEKDKKPTVTRVKINEKSARLRTESLMFEE